jgi:hypothetical protein
VRWLLARCKVYALALERCLTSLDRFLFELITRALCRDVTPSHVLTPPVFTNSWQMSYKKKERDQRRLANAILKQRSGLEGKNEVWIGATEGGHYYTWRL